MYGIGTNPHANYNDKEVRAIAAEAQGHILCQMFKATAFVVTGEESIQLEFKYQSADGQSVETRYCTIRTQVVPEINLRAIYDVLAQRRWYMAERNADQSIDFDPTPTKTVIEKAEEDAAKKADEEFEELIPENAPGR